MPSRPRKVAADPTTAALQRATVVEILTTGEILVEIDEGTPRRVLCDFLESAANHRIALEPGDPVLISPPTSLDEKGCVLGKVGPYRAPETSHVVISADEELTIKCGEGSITIRENGQVLIKGLDIVSHAKRRNRVRGGSIQLN